jgi:hypothetical protein
MVHLLKIEDATHYPQKTAQKSDKTSTIFDILTVFFSDFDPGAHGRAFRVLLSTLGAQKGTFGPVGGAWAVSAGW